MPVTRKLPVSPAVSPGKTNPISEHQPPSSLPFVQKQQPTNPHLTGGNRSFSTRSADMATRVRTRHVPGSAGIARTYCASPCGRKTRCSSNLFGSMSPSLSSRLCAAARATEQLPPFFQSLLPEGVFRRFVADEATSIRWTTWGMPVVYCHRRVGRPTPLRFVAPDHPAPGRAGSHRLGQAVSECAVDPRSAA